MSATELLEKKQNIIREIELVEDEWILKAIEKLLDIEDENDIEEYNNEIDEAMLQFKSGNFKTQEQVEAASKKW